MAIERKGPATPTEQGNETFSVEPFNKSFTGKDVVSVEQFTSREEIELLFGVADEMRLAVKENRENRQDLIHATVAQLFYQPSTRTFTSFEAAAKWLGCQRIIAIPGMSAYSSAVKGESLADTIRTIEQTTAADVIILRHPEDDSSAEAAYYAQVPIINAGSGRKEHPTQAILDLYTIREELGGVDNLVVTMTGDLRNGRTIKSLAKLLVLAGDDIEFNFISPEVLKMPEEAVDYLRQRGASVIVGNNDDLENVLPQTDVLYVTRIQGEWFTKQAMEDVRGNLDVLIKGVNDEAIRPLADSMGAIAYEEAVRGYVINAERMRLAKERMIVMHPLPRVGEIAYEVDQDPRAAYFPQMRYGLYTRMALLSLVLGRDANSPK